MCFWDIIGWLIQVTYERAEKDWCTLWVKTSSTSEWTKVKNGFHKHFDSETDKFKIKFENWSEEPVYVICSVRCRDKRSKWDMTEKFNAFVGGFGTMSWKNIHLKEMPEQHLVMQIFDDEPDNPTKDCVRKTKIFYIHE